MLPTWRVPAERSPSSASVRATVARRRRMASRDDNRSMLRVAVLDDYQDVALSLGDWSQLSPEARPDVFRQHIGAEDELVAVLQPYDVVVAMRERTPLPRSILERLPNLRLLVTTGAANAAIDALACRDLGITLCGTTGSSSAAAELTWALILACARRIDIEAANVRAGRWMSTLGTDLRGRTLGVLGLGRLGSQVAAVGRAFGMDVVAWSEHLTEERCAATGVRRAARDELFAVSDYLTIHLVLSDRTRGLVGEREFRLMRPTAWLINTSRGPICDEQALVRACSEHWIAGAGLDVFGSEPLPVDHPFRQLDNVIATPHVGYVTEQTYRGWFAQVIEDIAAFMAGAPIRVVAGSQLSA